MTQNPFPSLNPYSGHRDHRHAGRLALDAVYPYARDRMHFPELLAEGFEPHKVREVYLMGHDEPDVVLDITATMDRKLEALRCHASQLRDFAGAEARVRERAADLGKPHGLHLRRGVPEHRPAAVERPAPRSGLLLALAVLAAPLRGAALVRAAEPRARGGAAPRLGPRPERPGHGRPRRGHARGGPRGQPTSRPSSGASGFAPPATRGGFLQRFEVLTGVRLAPGAAIEVTAPGAAPRTFAGGPDFLPFTFSADGDVAADVVFAGYGITAPPLGYDDYAGLDVRGKVVLVMTGEPRETDPQGPFRPAEHFHYTELRHKVLNAREHGAAAVIVVENPGARATGWPPLRGTTPSWGIVAVSARREVADALLGPAGLDLADLRAQIDRARRAARRARCPACGRGSGRRSSATAGTTANVVGHPARHGSGPRRRGGRDRRPLRPPRPRQPVLARAGARRRDPPGRRRQRLRHGGAPRPRRGARPGRAARAGAWSSSRSPARSSASSARRTT